MRGRTDVRRRLLVTIGAFGALTLVCCLVAPIVGSGLALSGVVFQALLRNPLASSDTLGVAAGATLGATIAITVHALSLIHI